MGAEGYKIFIYQPQCFPTVLKCPKIVGADSLFFKIADAKAPIAPVLNTPPIIITHVRL